MDQSVVGAGDGAGLDVGTKDSDGCCDSVGGTEGVVDGTSLDNDGAGELVGMVGVREGDGDGRGDAVGCAEGTGETEGDPVGVMRVGDGLGAGDPVGAVVGVVGASVGTVEGVSVGILERDGTWERDGTVDATTVGVSEAVTVGVLEGLGVGHCDSDGDVVGILGASEGDGVGAGDAVGCTEGRCETVGDVVGPCSLGETLGSGDRVTGGREGLLLSPAVGETVGAGDGAGLDVGRCDKEGECEIDGAPEMVMVGREDGWTLGT
mmetsp:Transcript_6346/g.10092  ORF Transcript_6346/g.10092 Transcript_6346/m.10092 type:complete len:264 (-) Transcript_6346:284-1075(-)